MCRDLSENKIEEVPECVGDMPSITRLDLHTNEIKRVGFRA
jgi:Leucine-rich repeat (LRR) protein